MRNKTAQKEQEQQVKQLQIQDAKKTEFFLAASHQLKSPLAIVQWCLQCMLESSHLESKDRTLVNKALGQSTAMSHLITDMLHVFRLVNRKGKEQDYQMVNCNLVLDQAVAQCEDMARNRQIHLMKGAIERLPSIFVEEMYFKQAIINLLDNAIKYSPPGGKVIVTARVNEDHQVEIQVQDEGIGISEADQQKLFTEFFRSQEAQEMTHDGTGLGLVLIKHIIEEFGGSIEVKSQLHQGSTFIIRLPLKRS